MLKIKGYWIGRNKGDINKGQLLIGRQGHGGIPLINFLKGEKKHG